MYEERKEVFIERINSVINYAQNDYICRSRQLLSYFGEKKASDCGQCDVCLSHTNNEDKDHKKIIREKLLALVEDGEKHHITEIRQLDDNWDLTAEIMEELIAEDILLMNGSYLIKP